MIRILNAVVRRLKAKGTQKEFRSLSGVDLVMINARHRSEIPGRINNKKNKNELRLMRDLNGWRLDLGVLWDGWRIS